MTELSVIVTLKILLCKNKEKQKRQHAVAAVGRYSVNVNVPVTSK